MHMNKLIMLLISILSLSVITGCAGYNQESAPPPQAEATNVKMVGMSSGNLFFNPANLTLVKGQPVMLMFQNKGTHTFTIDELGVNVPLSGSTPKVEFTPNKAGTFQYYCAITGHREGGMIGSLKVE